MSSRSLRIPGSLAARVEAVAEKERRRFAAMAALLIEEALEGRARRSSGAPALRHSVAGQFVDADAQPRDPEARRLA